MKTADAVCFLTKSSFRWKWGASHVFENRFDVCFDHSRAWEIWSEIDERGLRPWWMMRRRKFRHRDKRHNNGDGHEILWTAWKIGSKAGNRQRMMESIFNHGLGTRWSQSTFVCFENQTQHLKTSPRRALDQLAGQISLRRVGKNRSRGGLSAKNHKQLTKSEANQWNS